MRGQAGGRGNIPVGGTCEAGLVVAVRYGRQVPANDLVLGGHVLLHVVDCHLEHPQVHVCDGREGPTCYKHERGFGRVGESPQETVGGKVVVFEGLHEACHCWRYVE